MGGVLIWGGPSQAATPVPWEWVRDLQHQAQQQDCPLWDLRRSPILTSPDGRWQTYSRLELQVDPQAQDQLTSVLFARDTQTQTLEVVRSVSIPESEPVGLDFIVQIPIGWQKDQLLVREHSGLFQSDIAEDQAVIWAPQRAEIQVIRPPLFEITELLDWDPMAAERVLFAVGSFGSAPTLISLGTDGSLVPRSIPIESFPTSIFVPPSPETELASPPWLPGLPQITGSLCGS